MSGKKSFFNFTFLPGIDFFCLTTERDEAVPVQQMKKAGIPVIVPLVGENHPTTGSQITTPPPDAGPHTGFLTHGLHRPT
jgi:hypothetical protein